MRRKGVDAEEAVDFVDCVRRKGNDDEELLACNMID
jgi:hypothetical protein